MITKKDVFSSENRNFLMETVKNKFKGNKC